MFGGLLPIKKKIYKLSALLNIIGVSLILVMVAITVADVLLRMTINKAIPGSYEVVEYLMGIVIVFALGYTQVRNGHISVTSFLEILPEKVQDWAGRFVNFVGLAIFSLIAWQTFVKAGMEVAAGTTSAVLYIPKYPFMYAAAFGFGVLCLVYIAQIVLPDEQQQQSE